ANLSAGEARYLNAVAVSETQRAFHPFGLTFERRHCPATPSLICLCVCPAHNGTHDMSLTESSRQQEASRHHEHHASVSDQVTLLTGKYLLTTYLNDGHRWDCKSRQAEGAHGSTSPQQTISLGNGAAGRGGNSGSGAPHARPVRLSRVQDQLPRLFRA